MTPQTTLGPEHRLHLHGSQLRLLFFALWLAWCTRQHGDGMGLAICLRIPRYLSSAYFLSLVTAGVHSPALCVCAAPARCVDLPTVRGLAAGCLPVWFAALPRDRTDVVSYKATNVCRTPEIPLWQNYLVAIYGKTFVSLFAAKLHVG